MPEARPTRRANIVGTTTTGTRTISMGGIIYSDTIFDTSLPTVKEDYVYTRDDGEQKLEKCILIEGSGYYLKTSKYLFKDDIDGSYQLNDYKYNFLVKLANNKPIFGFTHNHNIKRMPKLELDNGDVYHIYDIESAINDGYVENRRRALFMHKARVSNDDNDLDNITYYETFSNIISNQKLTLPLQYKTGSKSPSYSITEGIKYTFGVELEVCNGNIPKWLAYQKSLNISCVRDGSIRRDDDGDSGGAEYVTGVLTGDTGINHLQEICSELTKRTRVNKTCGVHFHLGGIDFTKQFVVNAYVLALYLEEEILSFVPQSRRNNEYCRKLKPFDFSVALNNSKSNLKLEEDYVKLFKYMSTTDAVPGQKFNKDTQHPRGAKCGYNHDTPRYCWLNFIPAMFNTRENGSFSLEIRNHPGSTNFKKIKNWLLLFMAFCKFVEDYPELITPNIKVSQILDKVYPKKSKVLMDYLESRKEMFTKSKEDTSREVEEDRKSIKQLITS